MTVLAVIDTNVLVSALLSKHADAATVQIIDRLFVGGIVPLGCNDKEGGRSIFGDRKCQTFSGKSLHGNSK